MLSTQVEMAQRTDLAGEEATVTVALLSFPVRRTRRNSFRSHIQHTHFVLAQRVFSVRQKRTFLGLSNGRVFSAVLWDQRDSGGGTQGLSSIVKSSAFLFGTQIP